MEKSRKKLIDKLLKELGQLAPNEQKAIVFIINNFSIIKKMCENSGMTPEEMKKRIKQANENDDYVLLALLYAVQLFDDNYNEKNQV